MARAGEGNDDDVLLRTVDTRSFPLGLVQTPYGVLKEEGYSRYLAWPFMDAVHQQSHQGFHYATACFAQWDMAAKGKETLRT